jgi:penicillin-binding protein 2
VPFPENLGERRLRAWLFGGLTAAILVVLAARLAYLQIAMGDYYAEQARDNMVRTEPLPAVRGAIFDREGKLLASNRVSISLSLDTGHSAFKDPEMLHQVLAEAAAILGRDAVDFEQRARRLTGMYDPMMLARDVDMVTLAPFVERLQPIPGLTIDQISLRWHPNGTLAAHALGYVGEVSEEELQQAAGKGLRRGQLIGRSGLERQYDALLRGEDGETYVEVDALGRKMDLFPDVPPKPSTPGADLYLSLNLRMQAAAESALAVSRPHGRKPVPGEPPVKVRGAVVALDPWSGEVLVCASSPAFDPNHFAHGLSTGQWSAINDASHPLLNRVMQAAYPPGSVFKIATTLAGLTEGVITPESLPETPCYGRYPFGNRVFRCWKPEGHGRLRLLNAFEQSCDIYYYQVGRALGIKRFLGFLDKLQLDSVTGIDLPQEREGLVPSVEWYRKRLGTDPPEGSALNLSIGQGEIMLTPIEIASFVGALVSDGIVRRPHIGLRAVRTDGTEVWNYGEPVEVRRLPIADEDRLLMIQLLEQVVMGDRGTGGRARVKGFRVGGKTGTAQNPHGEDHALFVGVAPMPRPEVVVAVVVEASGHGGTVAAPIAQAVLAAYLLPNGQPAKRVEPLAGGAAVAPASSGDAEMAGRDGD